MFAGRRHVLEVGFGDAFGKRLVQAEVEALSATDFDKLFVDDARERMVERWPFPVFTHDLLSAPIQGSYDGVLALDVLEHIATPDEHTFLSNALAPLEMQGAALIGMPCSRAKYMPHLLARLVT